MERIHHMQLNTLPFAAIRSGVKYKEGRLEDEKRKLVKVGDTIVFTLRDGAGITSVSKVVVGKKFYDSIEDMILEEGWYSMMPWARSYKETLSEYNKFYKDKLDKIREEREVCMVVFYLERDK